MYDMKAYYESKSVADAVRLRLEHPEAHIIAGGSDVLVQMREGKRAGAELISIYGIDAMRGICIDEDGNIRVAQGRFPFRAPGERGEYEEQHRQLAETPAEIRFTKLRAPAPDTISVKSLEVLSRFIDFRGGDRK